MMVKCIRCGSACSPSRSTSALVLTYCCMLCEVADLGYSLAAVEKAPVDELRVADNPVPASHGDAGLSAPMAA